MNVIGNCSKASWEMMLKHMSNAVVFLDNVSAECLHWTSAITTVFNAGATNIKDFSPFECGAVTETKAVFVLSSLLLDVVIDTLCGIVKASHFQQCIVISTISPALHSHARKPKVDLDDNMVFRQLEDRIKYCMKDMQAMCEVCYVPWTEFSICHSMFVTPAFSRLFPLIATDFSAMNIALQKDDKTEHLLDINIDTLPHNTQLTYKMLISSLSSLCERLEVNEDIYAIGHTSQTIATELAALPSAKSRRRAATKKAALVIIDRTLDLTGPVSHHSETIADKIIGLLPRLPGHSNDISVDMSELCSLKSHGNPSVLVPGCLSQPDNRTCQSLLTTLIMSKQKESLMEVNRQLVDVISKDKLPPKVSVKMSRGVDLLKSHLQLFSVENSSEAFEKNAGLLQLSLACIQASQHEGLENWNAFHRLEKLIVQNAMDLDDGSFFNAVLGEYKQQDMMNRSGSAEDLLQILIYCFSLYGDKYIPNAVKESLMQLLVDCLLQVNMDDDSNPLLDRLQLGDEQSVRRTVVDIFKKLNAIGKAREHLKQFRELLHDGNGPYPSVYKPFLQHVVEKIIDPSKPDLADLQHKSTGFRDRIKTSFRLFMNVSKPRPSDHPLLILYVIGGVTCSEIRAINELSHKTSQQVIIGSTCLLKPTDIVAMVFGQDNLHMPLDECK